MGHQGSRVVRILSIAIPALTFLSWLYLSLFKHVKAQEAQLRLIFGSPSQFADTELF